MTNGPPNGGEPEMGANRGSQTVDGSTLRRAFFGEQGIRAGWSVLLFVAMFQIFETGTTAALSHFVSLRPKGPIPPTLALIRESCEVPICDTAIWLVEPLGNVVGMAILGRAATEMKNGDWTLAIVLAAMAVECELVYRVCTN
jgi:hypothetical protein